MAPRLLVAGVLLAASPSAFAGSISFSIAPSADSIVVDVTINDTGEAPGCPWLALTQNHGDVLYIQRQVGTTITRRYVQTDVELDTFYCYGMALRAYPIPVPLPPCPEDACTVFSCPPPSGSCILIQPPDPVLLGRGFLRSQYPDGTPVDNNEIKSLLYFCGEPPDDYLGLHSMPAEAEQYLDTDTSLDVYGRWGYFGDGMWFRNATRVEPQSCILAVEERTWGAVKLRYRD